MRPGMNDRHKGQSVQGIVYGSLFVIPAFGIEWYRLLSTRCAIPWMLGLEIGKGLMGCGERGVTLTPYLRLEWPKGTRAVEWRVILTR